MRIPFYKLCQTTMILMFHFNLNFCYVYYMSFNAGKCTNCYCLLCEKLLFSPISIFAKSDVAKQIRK